MGSLDRGEIRRRLPDRPAPCEGSFPCPRAAKVVRGASARHVKQPPLFGDCHVSAGMGDRDQTIL